MKGKKITDQWSFIVILLYTREWNRGRQSKALTPSNDIIHFLHFLLVSTKHSDDQEIQMNTLHQHPSEYSKIQIEREKGGNKARILNK